MRVFALIIKHTGSFLGAFTGKLLQVFLPSFPHRLYQDLRHQSCENIYTDHQTYRVLFWNVYKETVSNPSGPQELESSSPEGACTFHQEIHLLFSSWPWIERDKRNTNVTKMQLTIEIDKEPVPKLQVQYKQMQQILQNKKFFVRNMQICTRLLWQKIVDRWKLFIEQFCTKLYPTFWLNLQRFSGLKVKRKSTGSTPLELDSKS